MTSHNRPRSLRVNSHQLTCVLVLGMTITANAQDPVATLPENYEREFENDYVRVTRVFYPAHAKLPAHSHTSLASAYVYLNDSGLVSFKHVGAEYGAVTRPPTVARAFRLYRGVEETHEVENLSDRPSEFLRVEFKTDPVDPRSLRGKFLPNPEPGSTSHNLQFENAQVRISRIRWSHGGSAQLAASSHPSLLVSLADGEMGRVRWLPEGQSGELNNTSPLPGEALRIEFKTKPIDTR